ncbi:hypothetical protein LY90DRAFT_664080 [Neocallimastix californiae]|uniref:Zn(2)-C6 fungal-type domain-containing protein n=1 Tax=Neocallimastix californiae TaxID=1754190 RepID=A0A1Y2FE52_9FUNG|nr:hypothetical protein LY90DRAFT_664080 [Neocallimastix californiae]|eukprot:ORY82218.1 hypothetical protein LY90DRAFT_664080 [Neocallimastix californiae]
MNFNENYYTANYNNNSLSFNVNQQNNKNTNNNQFIDISVNSNNIETSKSDNSNKNGEGYNQSKLDLDNQSELNQGKVRKKVTQACENCRKKRRKCTGERPKCLTCLQYNYVCYYNPFPKKRGPQQKREKRKYKKHKKENVDNNSEKNKNNVNDSVKFIENLIKIYTKSKDVNVTPTIYNNFINYETNINFKNNLKIEEGQVIESELINYSVIDYYYKYFHPNYPIVKYNTFTEYIKTDSLSKYLLFAMYSMAYLFQPNINVQMAEEYISKAKTLIYQNYKKVCAQLLQAIFLVTIYESGNNQSWVYSGFGMRIVNDSYFYYSNQNNNMDNLADEIQIMKDISFAFVGYDTWLNVLFIDKSKFKEEIRKFIDKRSKILICITNKTKSTDFQYFVMSAGLLILEIFHLTEKMKKNDFTLEDIDVVNTDIIKVQQYFFKEVENMTLIYSRQCYSEILRRISQDETFFKTKHDLLKIEIENNNSCKTVYEMYKAINNLNSFYKQKNWTKFSLITGGQRIYINRIYAQFVIDHPEKANVYPIAKSIAIASKTADDCTIGLLLLLEAAEENNNILRFSYGKAWVFYQCCIVYVLRYVATQEKKYKNYYHRSSSKFSSFSSYPQDTLAPCYFYLELLKKMYTYFSSVENYIQNIKLLIYQAKKSVKDKTFNIKLNDTI